MYNYICKGINVKKTHYEKGLKMKLRCVTILMAFVLLFTSCTDSKNKIISEVEKLINDPNANSGVLDMAVTVDFFKEERDTAIKQIEFFQDGKDSLIESGSILSSEEFDEYIRFFNEYKKYASVFIDTDINNISGEFYGVENKENDTMTPCVFVYTFSNNNNVGSGIDFGLLNKYFSEFQDGETDDEEARAAKFYLLAHKNVFVTVAGTYLEKLNEIKTIVEENIK